MKHLLLKLLCLLCISPAAFSQVEYTHETDEIIISAGRTPMEFDNLGRSVTLLTQRELQSLPSASVAGLLQFTPGVDVRQRGPFGMQSDIAVRGGSFEQTLILLDGVRLNDPQTGHHSMNLPVAKEQIERIEILRGHGSRIFGPNAFSGAINIITKKPSATSMQASFSGGEYGTFRAAGNAAFAEGIFSSAVHLSHAFSDGFRHNTDFESSHFSYQGTIQTGLGRIGLLTAYNKKEFGANGFYSASFPNQFEKTSTLFNRLFADLAAGDVLISSSLHWRRHDDDFVLKRENPAFYQNIHQTNMYGAEAEVSFENKLGRTTLGAEAGIENIESANLGNRERVKGGAALEHRFTIGALHLTAGAFTYYYDSWGWRTAPGIDAAYTIAGSLKLFTSAGWSFRAPTFTDLYYTDPSRQGNSSLQPEEAVTVEVGADYSAERLDLSVSTYVRNGSNIIDWVRYSPDQAQAEADNISEVDAAGFEFSSSIYAPLEQISFLRKISVSYAYTDLSKSADVYQSLYALSHLRHQAILQLGFGYGVFDMSVALRYEDRPALDNYLLSDLKATASLEQVELTLSVINLTNTYWQDFAGAPMPGRWITAGIELRTGLLD